MTGMVQDRPDKAGIQRQIVLPWSRTLQMTRENIFVRLGRSIITASGIFLGIAFMSAVLFGAAATTVSAKLATQRLGVMAAGTEEQARTIWLVAMSLVVATVGIVNSMLMSVTERYKEIGTMKCLGALDKFIVRLFILEAMLLGVLASFVGALVGTGAMTVIYWSRIGLGPTLSSWGQTALTSHVHSTSWLALILQPAWWQTCLMSVAFVLIWTLAQVAFLEVLMLLVSGVVAFVSVLRGRASRISVKGMIVPTATIGGAVGLYNALIMLFLVLHRGDVPLWAAIAQAIVMGSGLSVLATLYPAWRAAKMPPAAALRSEF
jgi:ABC-type antimicrobial peptide transport system permease subunit